MPHYFYLFHTASSPLRDDVSRFTMTTATARTNSAVGLWQDVNSPPRHHGGGVRVASDGKLYISDGDGSDRAHAAG